MMEQLEYDRLLTENTKRLGRTRTGTPVARSVALLMSLLSILGAATTATAAANSRDEALGALQALEEAWPGPKVAVSVTGGQGDVLRIGDSLRYRFASQGEGYLTAIHIDTHGATTLLYPRADVEAGRVGGARAVDLPSDTDGFELQVQPPVGRDVVYAVVTREPLTRRQLQIESREIVVSFEPQDAPSLIRRLARALQSREKGAVQIAHVTQQIDGRGEVQYRSADIVGFFGERTRSIRPAKLDLQIHFETDSAELDDASKRSIDEFAAALEDPKLAKMRFKVAGHTDDRGPANHNIDLSRRRADAVRAYLVDQGIDSTRLEIEAHGENAPLMSDPSDYARRMNRRVEFRPAR